MIEEKSLKTLEYEKILKRLSNFACSAPTREAILREQPHIELAEVRQQLSLTEQADIVMYELSSNPDFAFDNMQDELDNATKNITQSTKSILKFARLLKTARLAKTQLKELNNDKIVDLQMLASNIFFDSKLENDINTSILSETEIADGASAELTRIRKDIRLCNDKIRQKLN
ncbi:MAG: hypothetical protein RSB61_03890, partial [Clostridia bacterium]